MASKPLCRMDPPPRGFAADAHDCIMVRSLRIDRIQGCGAISAPRWRAPLGIVVVYPHCRRARPTNRACRRARDRQGRVRFAMACGHPLTVTARGGQGKQVGTRRWSATGQTRRWETKPKVTLTMNHLDNHCPIQGFRTPGMKRHSHALAAGVRKAPRHEIAVGSAPAVRRALNEIERCMVRGRVIF
jgi:hypothetical protein